MSSKQSILLRLSEEEMNILKSKSAEKGLSVNSYLKSLFLSEESIHSSSVVNSDTDVVRIKLADEDKQLLYDKAKQYNLTVTEYIRDIVRKKAFVHLTVEISDLHELLDSINTLSKKLNGTVAVLRSSGTVHEQDVQAIINIFKSIDNTCNQIYLEERKARYKLYEEARKRIFEDIQANKPRKIKVIPRK